MIDLTGERFGRLTAIERKGVSASGNVIWLCKCMCGSYVSVPSNNLKNGNTKSCGCLQKEKMRATGFRNTKHGHSKKGKISKTYSSWQSMIQRCTNSNNKAYPNYGGRGITVCERWLKFENFLNDMDEVPEGHQIDRIDNDGNYCKSNCRWATPKEQARNTRSNHLISLDSKTQCLSVWAKELQINYSTLRVRLHRGWSTQRALTAPTPRKVP